MNETISVIIPAYNAEKTIEACLTSVIAQTLLPTEVLVVDDHSHDSTWVIARRCGLQLSKLGVKFILHRQEQNAGPSAARNKAISVSMGTYIAFLDADDTWHPNKLEIINQFMHESGAGLLCHTYTECATFHECPGSSTQVSKELSIYHMLIKNPAQTSCAVVHRKHAAAFDVSMRYCEDYDLWMRIAEKSVVLKLVGYPLTRLGRPQLSKGGLSGNTIRMRMGEILVYYNFCRRAWLFRFWLFPILFVYSLAKHAYSYVQRCKRSLWQDKK